MGKLTKKQYRKELRSMLERIDELTAENRRVMAGRQHAQKENVKLMLKLDGLEVEISKAEFALESAERAINYNENQFDNAAEFAAKLIRYSNED